MLKVFSLKKNTKKLFSALSNMQTREDEEKICSLIEKGNVDFKARDEKGNTLLHLAADKGSIKIVQALVPVGTRLIGVNAVNNDGYTALHLVAQKATAERKRIIDQLLVIQANVEIKSNLGETALHFAAATGDESYMRMLDACVYEPRHNTSFHNVNRPGLYVKDNNGLTPLDWAANHGHTHIVETYKSYITAPNKKLSA